MTVVELAERRPEDDAADEDTVPMDRVPRRPFLKSAISRRVESVRLIIWRARR